jgi:hypothetical protein
VRGSSRDGYGPLLHRRREAMVAPTELNASGTENQVPAAPVRDLS